MMKVVVQKPVLEVCRTTQVVFATSVLNAEMAIKRFKMIFKFVRFGSSKGSY
jgi:hypothetical protein